MLKKLAKRLRRLTGNRTPFNPASLNDPVAMKTGWTPAKSGGTNFRTHKLVTVNLDRLEFRASIGAKLFYCVFLLIGLGLLVGFLSARISARNLGFNMETILPILIGVVFSCVGGCMLYFGTTPIVFDKRNGYFWKNRKAPDEVFDKRTLKHVTELERIHALQLVSEYCSGDKSSYFSYELNIVLEDGERINVIDHGNRDKIREDTATLSAFLKKPVWDAI